LSFLRRQESRHVLCGCIFLYCHYEVIRRNPGDFAKSRRVVSIETRRKLVDLYPIMNLINYGLLRISQRHAKKPPTIKSVVFYNLT
jgi:hypothetical protein